MPDAVALIDRVAHPAAWDYYQAFPSEPVLPDPETLSVTAQYAVDQMTWLTLLREMSLRVPTGGSVVIVTHGTQRGIFIPIAPGGPVLDSEAIFDAFSIGTQLDSDVARRYHVRTEVLNELYQLRLAVQGRMLDRVELRACNVGRRRGSMEKLLRIFQCQSFGCPRGRDSFFSPFVTPIRPDGVSAAASANMSWRDWDTLYPRAHRFDVTIGGRRVSLHYQETHHSVLNTAVGADSPDSLREWLRQRQPFGTWRDGRSPMHALVGSPPIFPGEPAFRQGLVRIERTGYMPPPQ